MLQSDCHLSRIVENFVQHSIVDFRGQFWNREVRKTRLMSPVNGLPQDCLFGWRYCGITLPVQGHCGVFQSCVGAVRFAHTQLVALV
jgi:hypothetical protein